jgi:hypothetical protein
MRKNQVATRRILKFRRLLVAVITGTVVWGAAANAQVVKGSGTADTIPVFAGNSTIGNSIVSQSGGNVNVTGGVKTSGPVTAPSFNGSFSGNGSGLSNVNASMFGGLGPTSFAQLGNSNTFGANQTIDGNLNLLGSMNSSLILQGNLTDSSGEIGANVIGGFGGNGSFAGNSVASDIVGATIAGGGGALNSSNPLPNTVTGVWGTVGGGVGNTAGGRYGTVSGGINNTANGYISSVVGGGELNASSGVNSTVGGGLHNTASGTYATVPGGRENTAGGSDSFAAGSEANANSNGSFVWNDGTGGGLNDFGAHTFSARASGGFAFYTAPGTSTGAYLPAGSGSWSSLSDRYLKANLMPVDGEAILKRLATVPILTWNYKTQSDSVRHMGPMAQDFREAFGLGEDEKHISTVDSEGIALAAIQALYQEKQQEVSQLQDRLKSLENRLSTLESSK